jgi:hypothetical protein
MSLPTSTSQTRRALLAGLGASALAAPLQAQSLEPGRVPVGITARPLAAFQPGDSSRMRFGELVFRGGLVLAGSHPRFGGFSGLWRAPDGQGLVAVTDNGFWLTGRLVKREGRLAGLEEAELAPVLGASGKPLHRSRYYDTESLALADGVAYLGVERTHDILRFDWATHGVEARARPLALPRAAKRLPNNRGLEALGMIPAGHALAGTLIAIAERSDGEDEPTAGFLIGGRQPGSFQVIRRDGFDITDLAFLPGGDMLLLERWYKPLQGVGLRIRRIAGPTIKPGARLDGAILLKADLGQEIDNMEGMAVHQESGRTIITLISDNNFSTFLQRTLLLEFELPA